VRKLTYRIGLPTGRNPQRRQGMADLMVAGTRALCAAPLAIRGAGRGFIGTAVLFFTLSVLITTLCCAPMASMAARPMPGGWSLSMTWTRMPGQSWAAAGAIFVANWSVMMVAMMLPSLVPMLLRYRRSLAMRGSQCERLTAVVAAGYFLVWTLLGALVFALGTSLSFAALQMPQLARAVPAATALLVLAAGALQFTAWKARALECCKRAPLCTERLAACALKSGLQLGVRCGACCAAPTAVLLALGVMDLHVMAGITTLISAERLAADGARVARFGGAVLIGVGVWLLVGAVRGG
jgi:predicted metal-binding membrane protein